MSRTTTSGTFHCVALTLLLCACGGIPVDVKVDTGDLGKNLTEAADKIDPFLLKELYRDLKSTQDLNDRLKLALKNVNSMGPSASDASFRVSASCTGTGPSNTDFKVWLEDGDASQTKDLSEIKWTNKREILSGTCQGAKEARVNRFTQHIGVYRVSWEATIRGAYNRDTEGIDVVVSYETPKTDGVGDISGHHSCTQRAETCAKWAPNQDIVGRSEIFWLRATKLDATR